MRPRFAKIYTWAEVAAMPATEYGPWRVMGCGDMARDPRTGLIGPAELVCRGTTWRLADDANSWFDTTSTDVLKSINLASLKAGWAVGGTAPTGGWVAGPASTPVICAAGNGQTSTLTYTITGRTAADHLAVVARCTPSAHTGAGTNYTAILYGDKTANKLGYDVFVNSAIPRWYLANSTYCGQQVALESDHVHALRCVSSGGPALATALSLVPPVWVSASALSAGVSATDYVQMIAQRSAEAGTTSLSVTSCAIYLGGA